MRTAMIRPRSERPRVSPRRAGGARFLHPARDQAGGTLLILLAVIGAIGVLATLAVRQIPIHARLAAGVEQRAILRNLAEAGIAAAAASLRRGRALPERVLTDERFGRFVGSATVRSKTRGSGHDVIAEARLTGPGAPPRPYRITVTFVRGASQRWQVAEWRESYAETVAHSGK